MIRTTRVKNLLDGTVVDPLSYGVEEEGPSANPREDGVIDFETPTVKSQPLNKELIIQVCQKGGFHGNYGNLSGSATVYSIL